MKQILYTLEGIALFTEIVTLVAAFAVLALSYPASFAVLMLLCGLVSVVQMVHTFKRTRE